MPQIVLFGAGWGPTGLGALIARFPAGAVPARPRATMVIGLGLNVAGVAATIAGGAVG